MAAACQLQFLELLASLPTSPELRMLTIVTMADLGSQLSELSIFSQFVSLSFVFPFCFLVAFSMELSQDNVLDS